MNRFYILLLFLFLPQFAKSDKLMLYSFDLRSYPTIKAEIFLFDNELNQITDLDESDIIIKENGTEVAIELVSCPDPKPPTPLSSVLTYDRSSSMRGTRMNIAKAAGHKWIDYLEPGQSECAVTCFDESNMLLCDFSTDKQLLHEKIQNIPVGGGTDYNSGLLYPPVGSLRLIETRFNKKIIVFMTDGEPESTTNVSEILSKAAQVGAKIYTIVLRMHAPESLKTIADETGGKCYELIKSEEEAADIYHMILFAEQNNSPCQLEWISNDCEQAKNVTIEVPGHYASAGFQYELNQFRRTSSIYFLPSNTIDFGIIEPGNNSEKTIRIEAVERDIYITDIVPDNPLFSFKSYDHSPFTLSEGDSRDLTVVYSPIDSTYNICNVLIESDACRNTEFYAHGGNIDLTSNKQIQLIYPNGGEKLIAGQNYDITWKNTLPYEDILVEYSTDSGDNWNVISRNARKFNQTWTVPYSPSETCIARISRQSTYKIRDDMILIPKGLFIMGNQVSYKDGNDNPQHPINLTDSFYVQANEVIQEEWSEVMGYNNSSQVGDSLPVDNISWLEAVHFCNKLSELYGLSQSYIISGNDVTCDWTADGYRLPTEAEWEYACKTNNKDPQDFYSGMMLSSQCSPLDNSLDTIGHYCGNTDNSDRLQKIRTKVPNEFGIYDMSGNVAEYCWDWYDVKYYKDGSPITDPKGPVGIRSERVIRGGSSESTAEVCRSAHRQKGLPETSIRLTGLRIVRNIK